MIEVDTLVVGAGIGGLSAASYLKERGMSFVVVEKSKSVPNNLSNGLHYLHSTDFPIPFHIIFKECPLTESVWDPYQNTFKEKATLPEMFEYSRKVMEGKRLPSSIMDPGKSVTVFVPESNDMNELINGHENYIGKENFILGTAVNKIDSLLHKACINTEGGEEEIHYKNVISTAPIKILLGMIDRKLEHEFFCKPVYITNYKTENIVPHWMTVLYIANHNFPPYRISVFNNIISMESLYEITEEKEKEIKECIGSLLDYELNTKSVYKWETGRIYGIGVPQRKEIVDSLIADDIYPIGRFALWNGRLRMDDTALQANKVVSAIASPFPALKELVAKELYG